MIKLWLSSMLCRMSWKEVLTDSDTAQPHPHCKNTIKEQPNSSAYR